MTHHDYCIIGAGPAGLQMGYFMERAGCDYLILEAASSAGSFFASQPRHRTLLSINKRFNFFEETDYNLRHDWNSLLTDDHRLLFRDYSEDLYPNADDLYRYLRDFAEKLALEIEYDSRVTTIDRDGVDRFRLTDARGRTHTCTCLLMGTGAVAPRSPEDIEGIELANTYLDHDLDPRVYENKRVLVIGRGNSAFEVANHLAGTAAFVHISVGAPVKHAWQTHFVGDLRAINNTILDMYQLKSLHASLGFHVRKIADDGDQGLAVYIDEELTHWGTPGTLKTKLHYDHVIVCTGWRYVSPDLFAEDITPTMCPQSKYPVLSPSWESTVPGIFYIGTAMAARDKRAASGFIHGFRYNVRTLFHILRERFDGVPMPARSFKLGSVQELQELADFLTERLSTSSALYQLNGFLADALVFGEGEARLYQELPVDYVRSRGELWSADNLLLCTLEYGFHNYEPGHNALNFVRAADEVSTGACSAFVHPVFRLFCNGVADGEVQFGESLVVRYNRFDRKNCRNELPESRHRNAVMNLLNSVVGITEETFPVNVFHADDTDTRFVPYEAGRDFPRDEVPRCRLSVPAPAAIESE